MLSTSFNAVSVLKGYSAEAFRIALAGFQVVVLLWGKRPGNQVLILFAGVGVGFWVALYLCHKST